MFFPVQHRTYGASCFGSWHWLFFREPVSARTWPRMLLEVAEVLHHDSFFFSCDVSRTSLLHLEEHSLAIFSIRSMHRCDMFHVGSFVQEASITEIAPKARRKAWLVRKFVEFQAAYFVSSHICGSLRNRPLHDNFDAVLPWRNATFVLDSCQFAKLSA